MGCWVETIFERGPPTSLALIESRERAQSLSEHPRKWELTSLLTMADNQARNISAVCTCTCAWERGGPMSL
jgi:hypothetical protein